MPDESPKPSPRTVEAIFHAVLALPPAERFASIAQACANDQQLRRRVEALLLAHEASQAFLPEQPSATSGAGLTELAAAAAAGEGRLEPPPNLEQPGEKIGPYKLLEKIGEGGCGVVYMAEQREPIKRRVALKIIKLGMDTRQVIARFEAERQALALMDHPNIAKVLDAGATETGRPYFVMELVRGIAITRYCDQHNLPPAERLDLFIKVCGAIQHAHQKGVIHRDIKPSNILVTVNDGVAVPKVIDFGIAKATNQELTDKTLFTAYAQFLGTPAYMSPEQAEMTSLDIDTRTDIYSLGVLLYELLTGRTPFDTQELLAAGLDAMRRTIREKEPVRPSTRLTQELAAADVRRLQLEPEHEEVGATSRRLLQVKEALRLVRGDLDWIVMKCLEKDRARRYETPNGLARDIERLLHNEPVLARPPSAAYKLRKFIRRNQLLVASAALIAAALVLGVAVSSWQAVKASRAEREQRRLQVAEQKARQEATENLWSAYLAQAHASSYSGEGGRRFGGLEALAKAAAIRPSLELRNEAIACMTLPDIRAIPNSEKRFKSRQERVSPDSKLELYAVGDAAGTVSIRRVSDDGEIFRVPNLGAKGPAGAAFSPDGEFLTITYGDGQLRVWSLASSSVVFKAREGREFQFTPDSKSITTVEHTTGAPARFRLVFYDPHSGQSVRAISLGTDLSSNSPVRVCFNPRGRSFALSSEDRTNVLIMDAESGSTLKTLPHSDEVMSVAWHPGGKYLASACGDNLLYLWDTATGEKLRVLQGHQNTPVNVAFNHAGNLLVSSAWDNTMRLWDFPRGRQLVSIGTAGFISGINTDDHKLGMVHWDGAGLQFFELAAGQGVCTIHETEKAVGGPSGTVIFSNNGRILAYPAVEGIKLWDVQAAREIAALAGEDKFLVGFDAGDQNVFVSGSGGLLRWPIAETPAGLYIANPPTLVSAKLAGSAVHLCANARICAAEHDDGWQIFDMDTWELRSQAKYPREVSGGMVISPDGAFIAKSARWHGGIRIWDARTGRLVKELETDEDDKATFTFSPDGLRLVSATPSEYRFWEVGSWSSKLRIPQPLETFTASPTFSRDGTLIAGAYESRIVRLFNAATGESLADFEPPNSWMVTGVAFNPDGTQLAVCEGRDAVHLWDLRFIRTQLAKMGLDWNMPPYPPAPAKPLMNAEGR
jgi:eukaryotic-like serine/threonine-protein kinase